MFFNIFFLFTVLVPKFLLQFSSFFAEPQIIFFCKKKSPIKNYIRVFGNLKLF